MKITKLNINIWGPIWIAVGVVLCITGRVGWWVFVLIFISHIAVNFDPRKGR